MPQVIFTVLAPIFFVMALGYIAGRMRTIDNHHVGEINALVMDFALPASLFASTGSAPRGENDGARAALRNPRSGHADYLSALVSLRA